ncbi:alcohol dehydrogenase family protein [Novosphingobium sp.]|uniref:alcohol dehydrogenase family protein n=1 Tax=Novosphingobium sp. TaxID=1874826 RepID=UPI0033402C24
MTVPALMHGVVLTGFGGYDRLVWREDLPVPVPRAGEVLVQVGAAGVNNTDINTRIGWYSKAVEADTATGADAGVDDAQSDGWSGAPFTFPRIQGADAAGRIVAVGADVAVDRVGSRVLVEPVFPAADGTVRYFGSECDGAFAQFALVPSTQAHGVDCTLTDAELASFPCAYSAALNMLNRAGQAAGARVVVTGASGGVGSAAVQLARARGAEVWALAGADKADAVMALGATRVAGRDDDLVATFGADSCDVVIDVAGGPQFGALLRVLRPGGAYAVAGAIAGPIVPLDLRTLYLKDLSLFGCTVLGQGVFAELVGHIESGRIRPLLAATYPLRDIALAQADFLTKRHVGKIVLTV